MKEEDLIKIVMINFIKKFSPLLILIFSIGLHSQNLQKIQKQETVFVFFKKNKMNTKFIRKRKEKNKTSYSYSYQYLFLNKKGILNLDFWLQYDDYSSIDDLIDKVNKSILFKVNKSFLRKNREIIITKKFITKIGKESFFEILKKSTSIFLIDNSETKDGLITVREVKLRYMQEE